MIERTVSFGWKEDVHELAREIVRVKEAGEQTKIISTVYDEHTGEVSAIVVYEQDGGAE